MLKRILYKITERGYGLDPLVKINISKKAILDNLSIHKTTYPSLNLIPVLKSNAYGHGLKQIAEILDTADVPLLMVDSLFESILLSKLTNHEILILGYTTITQINNTDLKKISVGVTSLEQLEIFSKKLKKPIKIHLKIDTGMHRQGILENEINKAISIIQKNKNIILEGLCSHFSDSDGNNLEFTSKQISTWNNIVDFFQNKFDFIKYTHLANSSGFAFQNKIKANSARIGLSLYGINSKNQPEGLIPALEMETIISGIKKIGPNEPIGYNNTFTSEKPMTIATIPTGYYEGVDRRLSNIGYVLTHGIPCRIVGRVSMNITVIDISQVPNARINDKVIVISSDPKLINSIQNISKQINTTPHEPLIHIPSHLKRIIV